jgi:hypothetical protein
VQIFPEHFKQSAGQGLHEKPSGEYPGLHSLQPLDEHVTQVLEHLTQLLPTG